MKPFHCVSVSRLAAQGLSTLLICLSAFAASVNAQTSSTAKPIGDRPTALVEWIVPAMNARTSASSLPTIQRVRGDAALIAQRDGLLSIAEFDGQTQITHTIKPDGTVSSQSAAVPFSSSQRPKMHGDLQTGNIYFHAYDKAGLVIEERLPDGQMKRILALQDQRMNSIFYDQSAGRLLGNEQSGFWLVNDYSGEGMALKQGQLVMVPGLSKREGSASFGITPRTFAIGQDNTLWMLEKKTKLTRINADGAVLASSTLPFKDQDARDASRLTTYGDGRLHASPFGVVATSSELQQVAAIDHQGKALWHRQLCTDQISSACTTQSERNGFLRSFALAAGTGQGEVIVTDGARYFRLTSATDAQPLTAAAAAGCDAKTQAYAGVQAPSSFKPCFGTSFRAAKIDKTTYLVASNEDAQEHLFELRLALEGGKTKVSVTPYPVKPADIPPQVRLRLSEAMHDRQLWRYGGSAPQSYWGQAVGLPIDGVVYDTMRLADGARALPGPNANTVHPLLYQQFGETARLGGNKIIAKTQYQGASTFWLYDLATRTFMRDPVTLRAAAAPPGLCANLNPGGFSPLLNDVEQGKALLFDLGTNVLSEITPDLQLRPIGCFPPPKQPEKRNKGDMSFAVWAPNGAWQDRKGRWWVGMLDGSLFVQQGISFVAVDLQGAETKPQGNADGSGLGDILQLLPGRADDLIALTAKGIAIIRPKD
jgi:hypothetical protein